jgi:PKD repeat protein
MRLFHPVAAFLFFFLIAELHIQAQECGYIYVTPNGSSAAGSGTRTNPASLTYAMTLLSPAANHIRMAAGTYIIDQPLDLVNDCVIEGGFNPVTWVKSNTTPTIIRRSALNPTGTPGHLIAVRAVNVSGFRLQDLTITTDHAGGNSVTTYGVYLSGCSNYFVTRCKIQPGNGSNGAPGAPGGPGLPGAPGQPGEPGQAVGNCCRAPGSGGSGSFFGSHAGGTGGWGAVRGGFVITTVPIINTCVVEPGSEFTNPGGNGQSGSGPQGGLGGAGGVGLCELTYANNNCQAQITNHGQPGAPGADGAPGAPGSQGVAQFIGGFYMPGTGSQGQQGQHGAGGGGGGGGGAKGCEPAVINPITCDTIYDTSGSGGGGGGGGEGGQGGQGGYGGGGGGGSFCVFVHNNGINGYIQDCVLQPGQGGLGGPGGPGGPGGLGGAGGQGGRLGDAPNGINSCNNGEGGNGGNGGNGGPGGPGGPGSNGLSMALYQHPGGEPVFWIDNYNPGEPPLFVEHFGCTQSDVIINAQATGIINWIFDYAATPSTGLQPQDTVQYWLPGVRSPTLLVDGVPYRYSNFITIRDPYTPPTIVKNKTTICAGDQIQFSTQSGPFTFQWQFQGGTPSTSSQQNPGNVTFSTPGTYVITLTTTSCCGTHVTRDTVYVITQPTVDLGPDIGICFTDPLPVLNAGNPGATYAWTKNGQPIGGNTPTLQTTGAGVYGVTISYGPGCSASDQLVLNVASSLPVNLGNDTAVCINGVFPLLDAGIPNAASYQWYYNGNPVGFNQQTFQTAAPGYYAVSVVSQTGCTGSDTIQVSISNPQVELGPNVTVCSNGQFPILNAGSQGITYQWTLNGQPIGGNTPTLPTTGPGLYAVTVINQFGCTASDNVTINTAPAPTASFSMPPTATAGQPVSFTNTSGPQPLTYIWNFGDNTPNTTITNPTHTYVQAGTYSVFLIVSNGVCSDTMVQSIQVLWDCNQLGLVAAFTHTPVVYMDLDGLCYTWNNSQNATGYLWDFGDGSPPYTTFQPTHVYTAPGTYTITLTAYNYNCTTSTSGTVQVIEKHDIGLAHVEINLQARIYPNPFDDRLHVEFQSESHWPDAFLLTLTDLHGHPVYQRRLPSDFQGSLTCEHLSAGVYILQLITTGRPPVTLRLIKL